VPNRNVNLTPEMDRFVDSKIRSGEYADASDVLGAGLKALERCEREDALRLQVLRSALAAGEESGFVEGDPFEQLHEFVHGLAKSVTEDPER